TFESLVARNAVAWANRVHVPTTAAAPVPNPNVTFPSASSIPPVSIMNTEPGAGTPAAAAPTPPRRPPPPKAARPAAKPAPIGPPPAAQSYLAARRLIDVAKRAGADCIHPGYGFLAENPEFAEACAAAGIVFVGPPPEAIRAMGLKDAAKVLMEKAGVPVVPGYHGTRQEPKFLKEKAYEVGYPVLIKAVAGGGGKGMRRVDKHADFEAALA